MKLIRWVLGRVIIFLDVLFSPKPLNRSKSLQSNIDKVTKNYKLYQYYACPFCVKVRRFMRKNNLKINLKDAKNNKTFKSELLNEGGKHKVPCLKIVKKYSKTIWLYESTEIIKFLKKEFKLS